MAKPRRRDMRQIAVDVTLYQEVAEWCYERDRSFPKFAEAAIRQHFEMEKARLNTEHNSTDLGVTA